MNPQDAAYSGLTNNSELDIFIWSLPDIDRLVLVGLFTDEYSHLEELACVLGVSIDEVVRAWGSTEVHVADWVEDHHHSTREQAPWETVREMISAGRSDAVRITLLELIELEKQVLPRCEYCETELELPVGKPGPPQRFCSSSCRSRSYRAKQPALTTELADANEAGGRNVFRMGNPNTLPWSLDTTGPCPNCGLVSNFELLPTGSSRTGKPAVGDDQTVAIMQCHGCGCVPLLSGC